MTDYAALARFAAKYGITWTRDTVTDREGDDQSNIVCGISGDGPSAQLPPIGATVRAFGNGGWIYRGIVEAHVDAMHYQVKVTEAYCAIHSS